MIMYCIGKTSFLSKRYYALNERATIRYYKCRKPYNSLQMFDHWQVPKTLPFSVIYKS